MAKLPQFAMLHTLDQWQRSAHVNTALEQTSEALGVVQLAWKMDTRSDSEETEVPKPIAGMAFDPWCRLYRCEPEQGQLSRMLWAADEIEDQQPVSLFSAASNSVGEFHNVANSEVNNGPLQTPVDVTVDKQGRLYIAELASQRVLVYDLVENRPIQKYNFKQPPQRLVSDGHKAWVLFSSPVAQIALLEARNEPRLENLSEHIVEPTALAVSQDGLYVIHRGGTDRAEIVPLDNPEDRFAVPYAYDMVFAKDNILVVARKQGEDFLRFKLEPGRQIELPHLKARHYDGRSIVVTPDGDVAYWSEKGLRRATLARVRYETEGRVTSFQLDSGDFQTHWGRLFVDACVPRGTRITAQFLSLDEIPETTQALERTLPDNVISTTIHRPDLSPPMPPQVLLENITETHALYRRENGQEIPWQACGDEEFQFQTYEVPIIAPPGRYLWVSLILKGSSRVTPKIKSVRAEYPCHELLRLLPQVYSREEAVADFLRRYLAMMEGDLRDIDLRASYRHVLLDPYATPAELMPWLGDFVGLVTDDRWPEAAQRQLLANAIWLFRFRGTVMGLKRFIEIYLGSSVTIIEHFKMRGLGGALVGENDALTSNSVLGAGFRIGGKLGTEDTESITGVSIEDAITTHEIGRAHV